MESRVRKCAKKDENVKSKRKEKSSNIPKDKKKKGTRVQKEKKQIVPEDVVLPKSKKSKSNAKSIVKGDSGETKKVDGKQEKREKNASSLKKGNRLNSGGNLLNEDGQLTQENRNNSNNIACHKPIIQPQLSLDYSAKGSSEPSESLTTLNSIRNYLSEPMVEEPLSRTSLKSLNEYLGDKDTPVSLKKEPIFDVVPPQDFENPNYKYRAPSGSSYNPKTLTQQQLILQDRCNVNPILKENQHSKNSTLTQFTNQHAIHQSQFPINSLQKIKYLDKTKEQFKHGKNSSQLKSGTNDMNYRFPGNEIIPSISDQDEMYPFNRSSNENEQSKNEPHGNNPLTNNNLNVKKKYKEFDFIESAEPLQMKFKKKGILEKGVKVTSRHDINSESSFTNKYNNGIQDVKLRNPINDKITGKYSKNNLLSLKNCENLIVGEPEVYQPLETDEHRAYKKNVTDIISKRKYNYANQKIINKEGKDTSYSLNNNFSEIEDSSITSNNAEKCLKYNNANNIQNRNNTLSQKFPDNHTHNLNAKQRLDFKQTGNKLVDIQKNAIFKGQQMSKSGSYVENMELTPKGPLFQNNKQKCYTSEFCDSSLKMIEKGNKIQFKKSSNTSLLNNDSNSQYKLDELYHEKMKLLASLDGIEVIEDGEYEKMLSVGKSKPNPEKVAMPSIPTEPRFRNDVPLQSFKGKLAPSFNMISKYPFKNTIQKQPAILSNKLLKPSTNALGFRNGSDGSMTHALNQVVPLPNNFPISKNKRGRKPGSKKYVYVKHCNNNFQSNSATQVAEDLHRKRVYKDISNFLVEYRDTTKQVDVDDFKYIHIHDRPDEIDDTLLYSNMVISCIKTLDVIVSDIIDN